MTALMRGASNWKQFTQSFNRNFHPDRMFDEMDDDAANLGGNLLILATLAGGRLRGKHANC